MTALASSSLSAKHPAFGGEHLLHPELRESSCAHHPRYWPSDVLAEFTLLMAGSGQCVNTSMMLGSREYAVEKLAMAQTLGNTELRELAVKMFSYFDDEPCHAVAQLVGSAFQH